MIEERIIDNFAGAGGASLGIEAAVGRPVDVAINHSPIALRTHAVNHPQTKHLCGDIWDYKPREVTGGDPVGLMWASPDCKHFSKAKGGKPVSPRVRGLAWVVVRWAREARPRIIIIENVEEFQGWGPLIQAVDARGKPMTDAAGRRVMMPDKSRRGETFRKFVGQLRKLGYAVEWRELIAADYGVPTTRKRLFLIARCDGRKIVWPAPTHARRDKAELLGLKPWRAAAECIDWTRPCPSIFERKRPLADATNRRIANGIRKYVIESNDPFIVTLNHSGPEFRGHGLSDPMRTLTASSDAHGLVAPTLVTIGYGERDGQCPRTPGLDKPLGTVVATGKHGLVAPVLVGAGGPTYSGKPAGVGDPVGTIIAENHKAVVEAFLAKHYSGIVGQSLKSPIGTITAIDHHSLVQVTKAGYLVEVQNASNASGVRSIQQPAPTVTAHPDGGGFALAEASLVKMYGTSVAGCSVREPVPTMTAGSNHIGEVRAFLVAYYSSGSGRTGRSCHAPAPTITSRDRLGLVEVSGQQFQIVDIGLRMLSPRELLNAQFGRFAERYVLTGNQSQQVAAIGNSVPPELAEALVLANYQPLKDQPYEYQETDDAACEVPPRGSAAGVGGPAAKGRRVV